MNLKKILDIYNIIKERIPSTYPKPELAFYENEASMLKNTNVKKGIDEDNVYAIVDPNTETIHLPLNMTFEYTKKSGEAYQRIRPLNKFDDYEIAHTLLHEIGHLFFGEKYGYDSKQYSDENACDNFSKKWLNKLRKEGFIK